MKKIYLLSFCSLLFLSCITLPGQTLHSVSKFDGSKQIIMEPAWLPYSPIKLALFKNTKMKPDEVLLTVVVRGVRSFSRGESLRFNVDGEIVDFKSIDVLTEFKSYHNSRLYWSSKEYLIDAVFIKKIIEAKRVVVKVNLNKEYVEGVFSQDGIGLARPVFRKFYAQIDNI